VAQGLLTTTAGTGSGIFIVKFYFFNCILSYQELDCEHVSSQLMALGLLTTTTGTGSGIFIVKFYFFNCILSYQGA
jgi:hypothetical protein